VNWIELIMGRILLLCWQFWTWWQINKYLVPWH
jgi:hypothetical protein